MRRWIMHVDMDAFFASVEQRDHPEWRGKPVIVGGLSARGVVATASYEARAYGVHSAMPVTRARRLCPEGIFTPGRFALYREVSEEIHRVMLHYASEIEPISLDEAFMDISAMNLRYASLNDIGRAIKKEIYETTGLVASAGIAPNKFLAKMASDMDKPDGLCIIPYGREKEILAPLPVRRLWGVGEVTEKRLLAKGFRTISDIQNVGEDTMKALFGARPGTELYRLSLGIDRRPIVSVRETKSVGDEETYETDVTDLSVIRKRLAIHADIVGSRLRRKKLAARTVTLKIRFADFTTVSRSVTWEIATNVSQTIEEAACDLLRKIPIRQGIRLTGITCSGISPEMEMPSLFPDRRDNIGKAERAVDAIREKFGADVIKKGI